MDIFTALSFLEIILLAAVAIGIPIIGHFIHQNANRQHERGNVMATQQNFYHTMILLWISTFCVLGYWIFAGRPFAELGLSFTPDVWGFSILGLSILLSGLYYAQVFSISKSEENMQMVRDDLASSPELSLMMPKTNQEYRTFKWVSVTAGITEEILFRGFLIWGFSQFTNIWIASFLALSAFVIAHTYQGTLINLFKVGATGAVMTALYLFSGSLLPAIIAHIMIDLTSNEIVWLVRKGK